MSILSEDISRVECTIPVLPVSNLANSIKFYTESLDFKLEWGGGEGSYICSVSKDNCSIMLSQRTMGPGGAWVWIGVEDDALFKLYAGRGVKVMQPPKNYPWAYEMKFEDPDGNVLWLGTSTRTDLPLETT